MRLLGAFLRLLVAGTLGAPPAPVRAEGREGGRSRVRLSGVAAKAGTAPPGAGRGAAAGHLVLPSPELAFPSLQAPEERGTASTESPGELVVGGRRCLGWEGAATQGRLCARSGRVGYYSGLCCLWSPVVTTGEVAGSCAEARSNLMPPAVLGHRVPPRAGAERSPVPRLPNLRCRHAGCRVRELRFSSPCWKAPEDGCPAGRGAGEPLRGGARGWAECLGRRRSWRIEGERACRGGCVSPRTVMSPVR